MRKCDRCNRRFVDGGSVECTDPQCPLQSEGTADAAEVDPTVVEPRETRDEVVAAAMETLSEGERREVEARQARSQRPALASLADLRAEIRASKKTGPPPAPLQDDEPDTEPLDLPDPDATDEGGEDVTLVDPDFDIDDVPRAADDEYSADSTAKEERPDLDEIRARARAAAHHAMAQEGEDDALDTVHGRSLGELEAEARGRLAAETSSLVSVETGDLPAVDDVDDAGDTNEVFVSEDPNFGQPPYQVIESSPGVDEDSESNRIPPLVPARGQIEQTGALPQQSGVTRWVDIDAVRDVIVGVVALIGCLTAFSLAVANWWTPGEIALATFGAVLVACAAVGGFLVTERSRSNRLNVVIKSAGIAAPFALVATLAWASDTVREWMFEPTEDSGSSLRMQIALDDPSDDVAARACRALAQTQKHHAVVIAAIDERPRITDACMHDPSSANHRVAANRLAAIWKARMQTSGDEQTCDYVAHYAELPIPEVEKFYDFFDCAFTGAGSATERCCGQHLMTTFGKGSDLVPGLQVATQEYPGPELVEDVLGPVLYPEKLDEGGRQNASVLELDDPELYSVALDLACTVMERPEASAVAVSHFRAIANDHCANQQIPGERVDDWRRVCEIVRAPRPGEVDVNAHFCSAVDMLNVARAVDTASITVFAATLREESKALESGIVIGTVREAVEQRESRDERDMALLYERINSRYDVQSKQKSLKALAERQAKLKKHEAEAQKKMDRWNSRRSKKARNYRRNSAEDVLASDPRSDPKWREVNNR